MPDEDTDQESEQPDAGYDPCFFFDWLEELYDMSEESPNE